MRVGRLPLAPTLCFATLIAAAAAPARRDPLDLIRGRWRVTAKYSCPHICAMDDSTARSYAGRTIEYSAARTSNGRDSCSAPRYSMRGLSEAQFVAEYNFYPAKLGLATLPIREFSVACPDRAGWPTIGSGGIVKDSGTILVGWDGVYFVARRE